MLRFGCRASNLVASRRAQTVRDFPSCADIDLDLACFRVERNNAVDNRGRTKLPFSRQSQRFNGSRLVLLVIGQRSRSGGLQAFPAICLFDAGEKNELQIVGEASDGLESVQEAEERCRAFSASSPFATWGSIAEIDRVCFIVPDVCAWNQFSVRRAEHGLANG